MNTPNTSTALERVKEEVTPERVIEAFQRVETIARFYDQFNQMATLLSPEQKQEILVYINLFILKSCFSKKTKIKDAVDFLAGWLSNFGIPTDLITPSIFLFNLNSYYKNSSNPPKALITKIALVQLIDFIIGLFPIIGDTADFFPSNTINKYILEEALSEHYLKCTETINPEVMQIIHDTLKKIIDKN